MFTLDELIVRPDEDYESLVEDRTHLFYSKTQQMPNTAFVSPDVYRDMLRQIANKNRHDLLNISNRGVQSLAVNCSFGTIHFKVITQVKSFLLVGVECSFADMDFIHGVPRELWSDSYRKKIDEDFEREFLK